MMIITEYYDHIINIEMCVSTNSQLSWENNEVSYMHIHISELQHDTNTFYMYMQYTTFVRENSVGLSSTNNLKPT